jgi:hypothetical protein
MPKVSRESAPQVRDFDLAEDRSDQLDGYSVSFVSIRETHDLAALLKGLPGDSCQCPHWGYVFKGKLTRRFGDRQEVYEAGDAFYVPPGHASEAEAGSEFVQFSPSEELHVSEAAMMANMQKMQGSG